MIINVNTLRAKEQGLKMCGDLKVIEERYRLSDIETMDEVLFTDAFIKLRDTIETFKRLANSL